MRKESCRMCSATCFVTFFPLPAEGVEAKADLRAEKAAAAAAASGSVYTREPAGRAHAHHASLSGGASLPSQLRRCKSLTSQVLPNEFILFVSADTAAFQCRIHLTCGTYGKKRWFLPMTDRRKVSLKVHTYIQGSIQMETTN